MDILGNLSLKTGLNIEDDLRYDLRDVGLLSPEFVPAGVGEDSVGVFESNGEIKDLTEEDGPDEERLKMRYIKWNAESLERLNAMKQKGMSFEQIASVFNLENNTNTKAGSIRKIHALHFSKLNFDQHGRSLDDLASRVVTDTEKADEASTEVLESNGARKVLTEEDGKEIVRLKNIENKSFEYIRRFFFKKYGVNFFLAKILSCYYKYCPVGERVKRICIKWDEKNLGKLRSMIECNTSDEEIARVFNSENGTKMKSQSFKRMYYRYLEKRSVNQRGGGLDDLASTEVFESNGARKVLTEEDGKEIVRLKNIENKSFKEIGTIISKKYRSRFTMVQIRHYYYKYLVECEDVKMSRIHWNPENLEWLDGMRQKKISFRKIANEFNLKNNTNKKADTFKKAYASYLMNKKRGSDESQEASQSSKKVCVGSLVDGEN